ncbi:oligosaccharide flippase family protein [Chryseobacterium suipulveris]|uniref:Oligosaccharide flippase family protein n=1 Tax=Chryseobacterium suipulveris TaxID=2929800 RepID=A0ABY4BQT7_9FLAO|nr:oligosaccharide flippase family protein [Chryseobacterium suipulveris]UOE41547.1 oligosaccharide flippase family protein [Chryseobacterium suipulveris]
MKLIFKRILNNSFLQDSFWALLGNVIFRGAALITSIMLARILQKTVFGEFNSLKNTLTTLAIFTTFGLGYSSTKFIADYIILKKTNPKYLVRKIYTITLVFSGLISFLLYVFSSKISLLYYNSLTFSQEIKILSLWVLLTAVSTAQNGVIAGFGIFKKLTSVNIVMGLVTILFLPVLAYYYGLTGACFALLLIQAANAVLYFILIDKELKLLSTNSFKNISTHTEPAYKDILIFSLPLTLIEAFFSLFLWLNYFLLQTYQNYDEVALYAAAMQWYIVLLFIPTVLRNVILSYFSKNDSASKKQVLRNAVLISFVTTLFPALLLSFIAPYISKMYGESFHGLTTVLRIVIFIPVFSSILNVLEQFLFSCSKNWIVFIICFTKDFLTFLIFFCVLYFWNVQHGAIYLTSAYLLMNVVTMVIYGLIYYRTDVFRQYLKSVN